MNKRILACCATALYGAVTFNAEAASIWLEPTTQTINAGEVATLEIWADASDVGGFLAGGLDLFYDSTLLTYNGDFAFDPAFPIDPFFSRTGDNCFVSPSTDGCTVRGEINDIAFGNFNGLAAEGPILVGTLSFIGQGGGLSNLTMSDNDSPDGNWFANDGADLAGLVVYGEATIETVPLSTQPISTIVPTIIQLLLLDK